MKAILAALLCLFLFSNSVTAIELDNNNNNNSINNKNAKAYFAGGCFWGVEHFFEKQAGVVEVTSGYMGGWLENPTYHDVSYTHSGHIELVEVEYNPQVVNYEKLARLFFEIHDPTQIGGQGPDIGDQYSSVIFYNNQSEKDIASNLISILVKNGYKIATELRKRVVFYKAEINHQNYYQRKGGIPYCHAYVKRF